MRPRRTAASLAALGLGAVLLWWWSVGDSPQAAAAWSVATAPMPEPAPEAASQPAPTPRTAPDRSAARALWKQRLERAQRSLDTYRHATRYPHHSRPLAEHVDQIHPNQPIVQERPLRQPGGPVIEGLTLRTTQERVFSQGDETVLFTVAAADADGRPLPLQVTRAVASEGALGLRQAQMAPVAVQFSDDGRAGDVQAADGVLSFRLQPSRVGFAEFDGTIRVEAALQSGDNSGYVFFDVVHSAGMPATWGAGVREAIESGSLNFYLPAQVMTAGRYVVTGRIDDARGHPVALVNFNEELSPGPQEFRLQLFGKLLRDAQPTFPLALRDVDAFLLKPNAFPDRSLMPRRDGVVYRTKSYPLVAFSDAEWSSEERDRYLKEFSKDVKEAEDALKGFGSGP